MSGSVCDVVVVEATGSSRTGMSEPVGNHSETGVARVARVSVDTGRRRLTSRR